VKTSNLTFNIYVVNPLWKIDIGRWRLAERIAVGTEESNRVVG
jgi:hypothetical protein